MAAAPDFWRRSDAATRTLLIIIALGIALRLLTVVSWWPVTPTLEDGYQRFVHNPFLDPQHPAGYGFIIGALGRLTRQIAFPVLVQHVVGIGSALLLWAATRRVTGSSWAALVPLVIVLLDPDEVFLEHSIMSESWAIFAIAASLYAAVRACEAPEPWWRWPLVTGVALAVAVMIRTASGPLIPVVALVLILWAPHPFRRWREHLRAAAVTVAVAGALLLAFAGASAASGQRFGIEPSPGWYLYGRVAQFANCQRFTPPPGTRQLCQTIPQSQRPTGFAYMYGAQSPAIREFGAFGSHDSIVGGWARRALDAQVGDFLHTAWIYLRGYFVPGSLPPNLKNGSTGLDPQLDFTSVGNPIFVAAMHQDLETYYDRFQVHPVKGGLDVLRVWQQVIRFGATLLFITTVLTLVGLIVGDRRARVGLLLFGIGGLSLLIASVLTGTYSGRYTVPLAGPMMAAAGVSLWALWRFAQRRRDGRTDATAGAQPAS